MFRVVFVVELSPDDLEGFCSNRLRGPILKSGLRKCAEIAHSVGFHGLLDVLTPCSLYVLPVLEIVMVAVSIDAPRQIANSFLEFCRAGPRFRSEMGLVFWYTCLITSWKEWVVVVNIASAAVKGL